MLSAIVNTCKSFFHQITHGTDVTAILVHIDDTRGRDVWPSQNLAEETLGGSSAARFVVGLKCRHLNGLSI